jgi:transcriptional regulator with XRE-family HTH domain
MERNICLNWQELVEEAIKRRKEQKLTQKQLAVLAGVSSPTLNSFEQGRSNITLDSAFKILDSLGLLTMQKKVTKRMEVLK